jgi:hypothetical protein
VGFAPCVPPVRRFRPSALPAGVTSDAHGLFRPEAAVIFGRSHSAEVSRRDGMSYLNPGSAGPRRVATSSCTHVLRSNRNRKGVSVGLVKRGTRSGIAFLLVACAVLATACGGRVKIDEIKKEPGRMDGRVVTIAGTVTSATNLFAVKFFKVRDATGEIAVVTSSDLPKEGDPVTVTGKVNEAFSIGPHHLVVIEEQARKR